MCSKIRLIDLPSVEQGIVDNLHAYLLDALEDALSDLYCESPVCRVIDASGTIGLSVFADNGEVILAELRLGRVA